MPIVLACITGLLVVSALSLILVRHRAATPVVYGACLTINELRSRWQSPCSDWRHAIMPLRITTGTG